MAKYIRTVSGIFSTTGLTRDKYGNYWNEDNEVMFNSNKILEESDDITVLLRAESEDKKKSIDKININLSIE